MSTSFMQAHSPANPERITMQHQFQVTGMTCGHCERAVVQAIRSIDEEALVRWTTAQPAR